MNVNVTADLDYEEVSVGKEELHVYGTVAPPQDAPVESGVLVVVVDTSRSMSERDRALEGIHQDLGSRISVVRGAIETLISKELKEDDIFGLVVFNTEGSLYIMSDFATNQKRQEWLDMMKEYDLADQCGGLTNLEQGMECAINELRYIAEQGRRSATLVVMCDGEITSGAGFVQTGRRSGRFRGAKDLVQAINAMLEEEIPDLSVRITTCGIGYDFDPDALRIVSSKCGEGGICEALVDETDQVTFATNVLRTELKESRSTVDIDSVTLTLEAAADTILVPRHPTPETDVAEPQGRGSMLCVEREAGKKYDLTITRHSKNKVLDFNFSAILEACATPLPDFTVAHVQSSPPGFSRALTVKRRQSGRKVRPPIQARAEACEKRHETATDLSRRAQKTNEAQFESAETTAGDLEQKVMREIIAARDELGDQEEMSPQQEQHFGFRISNSLGTLAGVLWTQSPSATSVAYSEELDVNMTQEQRTKLQEELEALRSLQAVTNYAQNRTSSQIAMDLERIARLEELTALFPSTRVGFVRRISQRLSRRSQNQGT
ncbi:Phospholipase A1-Ialpha2, chloroplastic [Hondaea fermentalgiana]|uniref:Phospholipase A1-Ialpha2, chloroplastic n=1 Tax=Hondaea fermentalgiana TaxID=2315210 RepID=A0A2R5GIC1_9STRA|nr:Phospholipase A1-Ialpha2, chloroplastic [Hondaea fermentalgiana]|eukprot:GBG30637.1 Phospholipase A1-Ialpha2, chloroplastic [Hondaea fermentalgiana]